MKTKVIFAVLLIAAAPASAALIETSTPFGVDTGVRDTDQNLVFVDFARTAEFTYDGLLTALGTGAMLDGYRLATTPQVDGLFDNAGLITPGSGGPTGADAVAVFNDFAALIDSGASDETGTGEALALRVLTTDIVVDTPATGGGAAELIADAPSAILIRGIDEGFGGLAEMSEILRNTASGFPFLSDQMAGEIVFGLGLPRISGFALVTDAPMTDVPAPGAALLFLLAVLGMGVRQRHLGRI